MAVSKNARPCISCGRMTTSLLQCPACYKQTDAGKAERTLKSRLQKYKPAHNGGPCASCLHWIGRCGLGLPEGGSEYARDCSVLLLQNELCEATPS
jgi:hypothetical protein